MSRKFAAFVLSVLVGFNAYGAKEPSTVYFNGSIYTANDKQEVVDAMIVTGDKVSFVGSEVEALKRLPEDADRVDLKGKMILPGLFDTHVHPLGALERETCPLGDGNEYRLEDIVRVVRACLDSLGEEAPKEGGWITIGQFNGYGADNPKYLGKYADIASGLDAISTEHKIILLGIDGHAYAVNHYALENAAVLSGLHYKVNAKTLANELKAYKDLISVNANGEPTGFLKDQGAWDLFNYDRTSVEEFIARGNELNQYFLSNGITTAQEAFAVDRDFEVFGELAEAETLIPRIHLAYTVLQDRHLKADGHLDIEKVLSDFKAMKKKLQPFKQLSVNAIKVFVDGVIEYPTQTAALFEPYLNMQSDDSGNTQYSHKPHGNQNRGLLLLSAEDIKKMAVAADAEGINMHFHAIGNRAVDAALSAIEAAREQRPDATTMHAIAHLQMVRPEDVDRFAKARVVTTPTTAWLEPIYSYELSVVPYIDEIKNLKEFDSFYRQNTKYMQQLYPIGSIHKAGGLISIGSDAPVDYNGPRPFTNMMYALMRGTYMTEEGSGQPEWIALNADERLNMRDILDAYTINGAKALGIADRLGSLESGKQADFIIINQQLIELASDFERRPEQPNAIENALKICDASYYHPHCNTRVLETYMDGRRVYKEKD